MSLTNLICITDYVEECVAGWVCGSRRGLSHLTEFLSGADNSALAACPPRVRDIRLPRDKIVHKKRRGGEEEPNAALFIALSKRWRRLQTPCPSYTVRLCPLHFAHRPLCLNQPQIRPLFCKHSQHQDVRRRRRPLRPVKTAGKAKTPVLPFLGWHLINNHICRSYMSK